MRKQILIYGKVFMDGIKIFRNNTVFISQAVFVVERVCTPGSINGQGIRGQSKLFI